MIAHFGPMTGRPLAAAGLKSYRYTGRFGFVMIGAVDDADALSEAARSIEGPADPAKLEEWNGREYAAVAAPPPG